MTNPVVEQVTKQLDWETKLNYEGLRFYYSEGPSSIISTKDFPDKIEPDELRKSVDLMNQRKD